ncbi:RNA polymerase sigma factor [Pseudophaeobacter sp. EL27]|uniref:RNA polymerase sigma factor n=1 Tax=Pseudophaeobacter sp. EL27 TaxID=2107580 RepID=UPI0013C4AB65|nr:RNA polymerase sigma factor [Pseudophaeobacter sp. EL27]
MTRISKIDIELAQDGDAKALESLVRGIQDRVHKLALRMLADPNAAQDATQEILIRIVTKLSTFRGDSSFETWTYRVATNYLLTARKIIANDPGLSFQMFADDLLSGIADEQIAAPEEHVMLNELRLKCTMAMLLCLDREHRAAYVLGDVLEFEHGAAADVLDITPGTYRKRLSRARARVQDFTAKTCGLASPAAPCSCRKRLPAAMAVGRIGSSPSSDLSDMPRFAEIQALASQTQTDLVAAKLQRATGPLRSPKDYAADVLKLVEPPG